MNFYQQKYFQPYKNLRQHPLTEYKDRSYQRSFNRSRQSYESFNRQGNYYDAPSFQRSPSKGGLYTRNTTEPIWEHLYNEGCRSKQDLLDKHEVNKNKIDTQCTFQPMLKQNKRFLVHSSSNFFERNNLWNQQKIEKKIKQKEEKVYSDLRECTFKPKINQRTKRMAQVSSKSALKADRSQKQFKQYNRKINPYYSPIKNNKGRSPSPRPAVRSTMEVPQVLKMIKKQLRRLNF